MHSLECELIPLTTGLGVRATDCRTKPRNEKGSKAEKFTRLCPYGDVNLNSPSFTIWTRLAGGCRRQYSPFLADSSSRTHLSRLSPDCSATDINGEYGMYLRLQWQACNRDRRCELTSGFEQSWFEMASSTLRQTQGAPPQGIEDTIQLLIKVR